MFFKTRSNFPTPVHAKEEWQKYLEQTRTHEQITRRLIETMGLDPARDTPGRRIVRHKGESLMEAMKMALKANSPEAAQLVAVECVVTAETKDHQNWELLGQVVEKLQGQEGRALKEACQQVEGQEDEHLYHSMGWSRELWIDSLGLLRPGGRLIMSAIHPDMQRLTGSVVRFTSAGREYRTHGIVHEVHSIAEAVHQSGLTPECLLEPCVDQELVTRRPAWSNRLGCPALVLLAAERTRSVSLGASQRIES